MPKDQAGDVITIRLSGKFKAELAAAAKRDHRTLSDQVRLWLHQKLVEGKKGKR